MAGPVHAVSVRLRVLVEKNLFGDEVRELLVALVAQEQSLAPVADEHDRVLRNVKGCFHGVSVGCA
jgi:hypothetical protein